MKKLVILSMVLLMVFVVPVFAEEPTMMPPHQFYGDVILNDVPAPDGLLIVLRINGEDIGSTLTNNGKYGYDPVFTVGDPYGDRTGKNVNFFLQGFNSGSTSLFSNDESARTYVKIDMNGDYFCGDNKCGGGESCSSCLEDCGTCSASDGGSGGGGSGGGGGGGSYVTTTITLECTPDWLCAGWNECISGVQGRECADLNRCENDGDKPNTFQECDVPGITDTVSEQEQGDDVFAGVVNDYSFGNMITGFITSGSALWGGLLVAIIIIALIMYFIWKKRISSVKSKIDN